MPNNRRRLQGRVVSNKMEKTVVVAIERRKMHRLYKKVVTSTKKIMAHDETNEISIGALVRVVESKPLSKNKRWVVEEVLETPDIVLGPVDAALTKTEDTEETEGTEQAAQAEEA